MLAPMLHSHAPAEAGMTSTIKAKLERSPLDNGHLHDGSCLDRRSLSAPIRDHKRTEAGGRSKVKRTAHMRLVVMAAGLLLLACSKSTTDPNDSGWRFLPGHVEALTVPTFRGGRPCKLSEQGSVSYSRAVLKLMLKSER